MIARPQNEWPARIIHRSILRRGRVRRMCCRRCGQLRQTHELRLQVAAQHLEAASRRQHVPSKHLFPPPVIHRPQSRLRCVHHVVHLTPHVTCAEQRAPDSAIRLHHHSSRCGELHRRVNSKYDLYRPSERPLRRRTRREGRATHGRPGRPANCAA